MQPMKWSRERLEELNADLLEENKRLHHTNWGRIFALTFFIFWAVVVCIYLTSPSLNTKSCKVLQTEKHSKS